ncbi:hypothetical protein [Streptomyces dysideae]|uniref:hypothetical protein n=1 Tax=Streptomyces dysideae TaxID=909626 RepID=UPI000A63D8E0|nr:hypothetical protein [Streptomyces dysideae]
MPIQELRATHTRPVGPMRHHAAPVADLNYAKAHQRRGPRTELPATARVVPTLSAHLRASLVVSVETPTSGLAARLHHAGLAQGGVLRWGSDQFFASILELRPAMLLLDAPAAVPETLARLVRAASLVAPVAVLRPDGSDAADALDAGACDVLDPTAPTAELTWRIRADLRRCPPPARNAGYPRGTSSQRLLFHIASHARSVVCCHHLRLLFGTPDLPMTLRALRARLQRLLPAFSEQGLELIVDQQWGLATYCTRSTLWTGPGESRAPSAADRG